VPPQEPLHRCTPDDLHCGALFDDTAYVMPNGRLIPCPRFIGTPFETALPSLLDVSLSEAWADEGLRSLLGVTKAEVLARNPECAACDEFVECGAGCWATAYAAGGDVFGRDPVACALWKSPHRRRLEEVAAGSL
jgi:radical SAM protein with 4Fe4S-binding SPASM domain